LSLNQLADSVLLAIYPDHVVWLRVAAGLRRQVTAKGVVSCAVDMEKPWQGAIAVLPQVLVAAEVKAARAKAVRVSVVLSNRLVRYAIMPNPDSARNQQELDLLARHVFQRAHGDVSAQWDIRLSDAAPGQAALASAVDSDFCLALRDAIVTSGARLVSLQPYLMAAFNQSMTGKHSGIFVLTEPQRLCLLAQKNGGWAAVQQSHAEPDWLDALPEKLDRLAVSAGLDDAHKFVLCAPELAEQPERGDLELAITANRWQLEKAKPNWIAGLIPVQDRSFAGAMLALS
jgi:hypothetical protein